MRIVLAGVAVLAALVFMAASAAMNWVFLKSLGKTELEGQIYGGFSVALDVVKSLLPVFIGWALANKRRIYAGIASLLFGLLLVFSLGSAIGFSAINRGAVTEGKDVLSGRLTLRQKDLKRLDAELAALPAARPSAALREAIRALEQDRRWPSSKQCSEATAPASREFCEGYFKIKAELASAIERAELQKRMAELGREIAALEDAGAGKESDAQASLLARLLRIDVSNAQMALVMFIAVLVELLAAFGLYIAIGWWPRRAIAPAPVAPSPPVAMPMPVPVPVPDVVALPPPAKPAPATAPKADELEDADYWSGPIRRLQLVDAK